MERRKNTRIPFTIDAVIRHEDRPISGTLLNISLCGMCIEIQVKLPLHAAVDVDVILENGGSRMSLTLPGEVIRSEPGQTAVKLTRMTLDSYSRVRDLMMNNTDDPGSIMTEFHKFISENRIGQPRQQ